ncbi:hypothetical protein MHBO_004591, partial [Bonamia ostreae]
IFGSCSVDRSVCLWDLRTEKIAPVLNAKDLHSKHINVLSWNQHRSTQIATGSDDCSFKVWDLRHFDKKSPISYFKWHRKPITSLEWSPFDETVLMTSSEDDTIGIWDLSLENDIERKIKGAQLNQEVPPQLLFVHMGQQEIKESHFHPQIKNMVISTASKGYHLFIPENI